MMKNVVRTVVIAMMLMTAGTANAQLDLKGLAEQVLGGSSDKQTTTDNSQSGSSSTGGLIQSLTSIFSKDKQAKANNIVGTWEYSEPAIVLNSGNLLTNAAYKLAANKIETKLQSYLTQYGIAPGTFSITFNQDGTCTETLKGKTVKGKWKIENQQLQLSIGSMPAVSITTQISGKEMMLVTDATKLLNMFQSFGANSSNSNIKTVATLLKGVKEMQAGITLKKK